MDVTGRLLRFAAGRPHPFLVGVPGATGVLLAAQRGCRQRGWPPAESPAEADLLLVCGSPGPLLAQAVARVWEQMPGPRARATARRESEVGAALDEAREALGDVAGQRAAAAERVTSHDPWADASADHAAGGDGGHGGDHGGYESGHSGTGGHGEHGGRSMPGGLGMAGRGDDRDGLALDVLHVPLGPLLPDWPAGLVVHTVLQGDVIQSAQVRLIDAAVAAAPRPLWDEPWLRAMRGERVTRGETARHLVAARLDSLGRLLAVAGWADAALAARALRDELLTGAGAGTVTVRVERFSRRVRRCRFLRWMMRGLGRVDADTATRLRAGGTAAHAGEDAWSRVVHWLDECVEALPDVEDQRPLGRGDDSQGPRGRLDGDAWPSRALIDALPRLLEGTELSRARLVVASLDPDPDELLGEHAVAEVAGG